MFADSKLSTYCRAVLECTTDCTDCTAIRGRRLSALAIESQQSVVVVDSQGVVTSELGPGALRDLQTKAERASHVADARADVVAARADVAASDAAVAAALGRQASCHQRLLASERLVYDMSEKV
jgi:hypothetical protein